MGATRATAAVSREAVQAQLGRILASKGFAHAERLSGFLRFVVQEALEGRGDQLKEHVLGVEVFARGESFDPRIDTVVRVEAHRLRSRLQQYYATEGRADALLIDLSKGSYAPVFRPRPPAPQPILWRRWKRLALAAAERALEVDGTLARRMLRSASSSPSTTGTGRAPGKTNAGPLGQRAEGRSVLKELEELSRREYVSPTSRAWVYIGLADKDRAFQWLERAREERDGWLAWLKVDPVFDSLRADARFERLLETVGLKEAP